MHEYPRMINSSWGLLAQNTVRRSTILAEYTSYIKILIVDIFWFYQLQLVWMYNCIHIDIKVGSQVLWFNSARIYIS